MTAKPPARILVVDDSRANRLILARGLTAAGHEVLEADSAARALELLRPTLKRHSKRGPGPEHIDLVLLDIVMPGGDGTGVLHEARLHKSPSELPIIMATSKDTPEDVVEALHEGANDYITKPVHLPVAMARVQTHLRLRETHRALTEAQHSLIRAAKMETISFLAAGVAHEIRNPLARLQLGLQALERRLSQAADDKLATTLSRMDSSLSEADSVVQGLMNCARDGGLELEATSVHSLIMHTLGLLRADLRQASVAVVTEFDPELPPALAARTELAQALINVFLNAIQAMDGGGRLAVRTAVQSINGSSSTGGSRSGNRLREGEEAIVIEIRDTGPGLPEDELLKVFDAFYTSRPTGTATGLGLTVARKIIELHGGRLDLCNRVQGAGLRATIALRQANAFQTTV